MDAEDSRISIHRCLWGHFSSQSSHRQAAFTPHRQPILQSLEGQVMDMKRFAFLLLLVLFVSATAWAGVRLNLDSGATSGSTGLIEVTETSIDGETGSEASAIFLGEGSMEVQTPSLSALLTVSHESVYTLETVTFDASGSQPGAGEIILYEWDLNGEGIFDESSTESTITRTYTEDGTVSVQVRITDDLGKSVVSDVLLLTIVNRQPLARFSADFEGSAEGSLVQFVDSSHDDDGVIASWMWDFGDGFTSNESSPSHTYNTSGVFRATLSVTDNDGVLSETYGFEITVLNTAPQAEFTLDQPTVSAGSPLILIDESFDPSSNGEIVHVAWDFGDGVYQAGGPSSNNEYSHAFAVSGTYVITLYVIDNDGAMARTQMTIQVL
jgi:PKD repeat protein